LRSTPPRFALRLGFGKAVAKPAAMKQAWQVGLVLVSAVASAGVFSPIARAERHADEVLPSQVRSPGEDWQDAAESFLHELDTRGIPHPEVGGSAYGVAVPLSRLDLSRAPDWSSDELSETFAKIRDLRFLHTTTLPDFLRRISWLYPDDGCFARAQMVNEKVRDWGHDVPKRLFIFGNLAVKTPNAPGGAVYWWYHVVPAVEVEGSPFVIDAAIDPERPLPLNDWILSQARSLSSVRLALCDGVGYDPSSTCRGSDEGNSSRAMRDQRRFLTLEWNRLVRLGRDPRRELGDSPPWSLENEGRE
jgi:hypothetical protein